MTGPFVPGGAAIVVSKVPRVPLPDVAVTKCSASFFRPATLTEDDTPLETPKDGFYLTDAISDHGVSFVQDHQKKHPDQPFFMYVAYTAPHWPLHALKDDIDRYRGKYREGWDKLRVQRHERMKEAKRVLPWCSSSASIATGTL